MDMLGYYDPGIFVAIFPCCKEPEATCKRVATVVEGIPEVPAARQRVPALSVVMKFVQAKPGWTIDQVRDALGLSC
jgi:hypothetical protein